MIRSTRRFFRLQHSVVVACLPNLGAKRFVVAGAELGGWAPVFCLLAVLSILTVKTPAVSSRRGDEVLKAHAPSGARRKQLLVLCIRTGLRPSRDTAFCFSSLSPSCFFSGFCLFLWLAVPWTSEQRTPPCTTATLLSRPLSCSFFARSADNLLLRMFSPSLGDVSVSAPARSFLSHFPASSCFDWA